MSKSADEFARRWEKGLAAGLLIGLVVAAGPASGTLQSTAAAAFDFSAVDRIWKITAILESDREPAAEDWEALVQTPGYAALLAHERYYGLDFLKRNLRLVFKPSLAADLAKATRTDALRHFLELKAKKPALLEFQVQMKDPAVGKEALRIVKAWLPEGTVESRTPPSAAFIVFGKDARGGYGPLIFDLLYAFEQGDSFKALFAHEAHHYYSRELSAFDPGSVRVAEENVLQTLGWIQGEGLADQIDKVDSIFDGGPRADSAYAVEYRKNVADSPRILGTLDRLLGQLRRTPSEAPRIGTEMAAAIPQSGHPTGYFMARAVLADGGRAELVRTFANPFAFFYLYNASARKHPDLPRFSNAAVAALRDLEKRLVPRPEEGLAEAALSRGIDTSAVALFRTIAGLLAKDEEPDPSLWDRLFGHPGYQVYFADEGVSRDRLREAISLACKPGREAERKQALEKSGSNTLRYFAEAQASLEEAAAAAERFQTGGAFETALAQTLPFLPRDAEDALADVSIAVLFMGTKDLRFGYHPMLVDALYIRSAPIGIPAYLRLHLLTRCGESRRLYDPSLMTRRQAAFLDAWASAQTLGLSDLLIRQLGEAINPDFGKRYELKMQDVPRQIDDWDRVMKKAAADASAWQEMDILRRDLFLGTGCPIGFFMASTIRDVLGREALAETAGRPAAFVQAYRKAALRKGGLPALSDESVTFLAGLEREAIAQAPGEPTLASRMGKPLSTYRGFRSGGLKGPTSLILPQVRSSSPLP